LGLQECYQLSAQARESLPNLLLVTSYKFLLHVSAAACEVEFDDGFLFGRDRFVAAIASSPLNHAEKCRRWLRDRSSPLSAGRHFPNTYPFLRISRPQGSEGLG
jgi:hypothetical protein